MSGKRRAVLAALFLAAATGGLLLSGLGGVAQGSNASSSTKRTITRQTTTQGGGSTSETTPECPPGSAPDEFGDCISTDTETEPSVPPDLKIVKEGPSIVQLGRVMVFRLSVVATNTELPPGAVITVTELVPAGTTYRGAGGTGWTCTPPPPRSGPTTVTCRTKVGEAGLTGLPVLTVLERADSPGRIENCASVAGTVD